MAQSHGKDAFGVRKLKVLDDKYVVKISENYMGLSYGEIIITWQRWLLSEAPDEHQYGDILFLRGNLGYHQSNSHYFRSSLEIFEGMGILVPIVTTHYNIGERYKRRVIDNEFYLRKAVREHVDAAGPFWATMEIIGNKNKVVKIVQDLESYRVESMPFELDISNRNPFLNVMDEPNHPGKYTALVSGYFVILRDLPPSLYRIRFGAYGMDRFYTESLYEINIKSRKKSLKDISGSNFIPSQLFKEKKKVIEIVNPNHDGFKLQKNKD